MDPISHVCYQRKPYQEFLNFSEEGSTTTRRSIPSPCWNDPSLVQTAEDLDELRKYLATSRKEMASLDKEIAESAAAWTLLERLEFETGDAHAELHWATAAWPQRMQAALQECEARLASGRVAFTKELARDQQQLLENIEAIAADVKQFIVQGDIDQVRKAVQKVGAYLHALTIK